MFAALFVADAVRAAEVRVTGVTGAEHARAESARQHQLQVHTLYKTVTHNELRLEQNFSSSFSGFKSTDKFFQGEFRSPPPPPL